MATTTNYGWTTPNDTDLVKDGAAAIRTLGNSIDTTTKNLNPETTLGDIAYRSATANTNTRLPIGSNGQILGVSAGVPAWINNDQGDITEVQAGTGISVSSGTGPIPVVTNTVATAYDAKGDLIVGTGADTFSRLAVGGTNGHTLQVDSSTSTGLKWAAASAAFAGVLVYQSTGQNFSNATSTVVTFNSESYDTDAFHSTSTNTSRLTVPAGKAGKYMIFGQLAYNGNATGQRQAEILLNGSGGYAKNVQLNSGSSYIASPLFTTVLDLAVGDYVELGGYQDSGGTLGNQAGLQYTYFGMTYLGA